ncbi:MAG TPA: hypothetical protein VGH76_19720 [Actinomycetospora sp.]|jgi:hypothetical protein|uniref:hypothetical protein n=1 Tax=Actinomycetospora sp. TaxID=1872135 RepID=UPI002F404778
MDQYPTQDDAIRYSADFFTAVEAYRTGDTDTVVDVLAGPETDDQTHMRHLYAMFSVAAMLAGRAARKACADPDDPAPMDGPAMLEIGDVRTGLRAHPEDLDPDERVTLWALAAGANVDVDGVAAHLRTIGRRGGPKAVCDGILTFVKIMAAAWDGESLS